MSRLAGPLVAVAVTLLCLLAAEVGLRALAPMPDPYEFVKRRDGVNLYIRSAFAPNLVLRTEAEDGLPGVSGQNLFTTNNLGFRGDPLELPKPPGEYRVFMIGGSTTEGLYLDDADVVTAVLQRELQARAGPGVAVRVYGAGKSGDRSDDHVTMLVHRIVHLEPDLVIVFAGVNDLSAAIFGHDFLHPTPPGEEPLGLRNLLQLSATEFQLPRRIYYLVSRMRPPDPDRLMEELPLTSDYRRLVEQRRSGQVTEAAPPTNPGAYRANLRTIAGTAAAQGFPLAFVTQPSTWNSAVDPRVEDWQWMLFRGGVTYRADRMDEALESLNEVMRAVAAEAGAPLYDLARLLPKSLDHFYDDVHLNAAGAREVGRGLAAFLSDQGAIPHAVPPGVPEPNRVASP